MCFKKSFGLLIAGWSISDVKQWVMETFESEEMAAKFESEEADGVILMSQTITTTEAMEKLGLNTIGKKGKFLGKEKQLSGKSYILLYLFSFLETNVLFLCLCKLTRLTRISVIMILY